VFLVSLFRAFETITSHSNSTDDAAGIAPDYSVVRGRFSKIERGRGCLLLLFTRLLWTGKSDTTQRDRSDRVQTLEETTSFNLE
jgi:hypothetical protein